MKELVDAFWRAAAYCLHPRVILWSVLPLVIAVSAVLGLGWLYWESAVDLLRAALDQWDAIKTFKQWLRGLGAGALVNVFEPLIIVALAVPVVVVASLMLVALLMTPAIVRLVAARRFALLQRKQGASWGRAAAWSLGCTLAALLLLILSVPLWLVPPLVLVLPPMIWGWLTYRVMSFDVLADHASNAERVQLMREHRWPLLAMGVVCGYLGAAPALVWAASALIVIFAPVLIVVSIWLYTLVFAFSALWFAHYALAALQRQRAAAPVAPAQPVDVIELLPATPKALP